MKNLMSIILPIFLLASLTTAQDDITPPELTYFSFTPDSVDVTDSSAVVNVTFGAIDDLSGVSYAQAFIRSPSDDQYVVGYIVFNGSTSDTLMSQMIIEQYSESGEWYVDFIEVGDEVGNWRRYYTSELDSMGMETILTVNYSSGYEGQVLHVATTGTDSTGDGSEENPFATIQHGIDAANDGDTVLVQPGVFSETVNYEGKNIVVGSQALMNGDTSYIRQTIIDGGGTDRCVYVSQGENSNALLYGVTLQNGYASSGGGGGILINGSSPRIQRCLIINNTAYSSGGGMALQYSDAVIDNCTIAGNSCMTSPNDGDGGIAVYTPAGDYEPTIKNCIVYGNNTIYQYVDRTEQVALTFSWWDRSIPQGWIWTPPTLLV